VGLDEGGSMQNKCGCTRRIARSNSGFCFPHEKKNCEDHLKRKTSDLRARVAKCIDVKYSKIYIGQ